MRGIDTSSTATFGRCAWVDSSAATPSVGLGHDLHVGLAVDQHPQARAHDAVVVGDQDADHAAPSRVARSGASRSCRRRGRSARRARRRPAGRARPCRCSPSPAPGPSPFEPRASAAGSKPAPSSRTRSSSRSSSTSISTRHGRGAGVAADVRERLLEDPVDGGLHVLGRASRARPRRRARTSTPVRAEKRLSCVSIAGTRPWSSSAVGRSWRARLRSSSIAWFTSRFSSVTSATCSGGLSWASASSRSRIAVSAWFTSSWRSRASRRRSSSCARMASVPERRRSSSMRSSRPLKELDEPVDLLDRVRVGELVAGRLGGVDPLDPLDQALERREAALEHPQVHAQREHDREREDQELPALVGDGRGRGPAARLAANSVRATSTTFAATIWPMRESSRRVIEGLFMDRNRPRGDKWGLHPISARAPERRNSW